MKLYALALLGALTLPLMAAAPVRIPKTLLPTVWVSGSAPQTWPTNEVYLIECWATWCGPCVAAIPHMEELWKQVKGKGVHIIGLNVADRKSPEEIKTFLAKQPTPPTYPNAIDQGGRFADAIGLRSIPKAVAIRNGEVIWVGDPRCINVNWLLGLVKPQPQNAQ